MPRKHLDTTTVVRAAADILNEHGWESLSLGKLAEKLGIQSPSLYNHINGLPGLQRELILLSTRELGDVMARAAIGQTGAQAVRKIAQAYREYVRKNTGLYMTGIRSARMINPADIELDQAQQHVLDVGLAVLSSFELDLQGTLHALRGLRSIVHGFATLEAAGGFGLPLDCDESFRRLVEGFISGLENRTSRQ